MLGAQMMVFGSITQLDGKNARMVVRVVDVETSEIVTTADMEGKPNFVEMEKELVKDVAGKLNLALSKEAGAAIEESATTDMDAARLYSLGLKYMDEYSTRRRTTISGRRTKRTTPSPKRRGRWRSTSPS